MKSSNRHLIHMIHSNNVSHERQCSIMYALDLSRSTILLTALDFFPGFLDLFENGLVCKVVFSIDIGSLIFKGYGVGLDACVV